LGFFGVSFGEHPAPSHGSSAVPLRYYDPLVMGAVLLTSFQRLRVLFNVLVVPYRHPVVLAKALATLDVISEGRVIAGLGAGYLQPEFEALGVSHSERRKITDEYIQAMRALWSSSPASFVGRYT